MQPLIRGNGGEPWIWSCVLVLLALLMCASLTTEAHPLCMVTMCTCLFVQPDWPKAASLASLTLHSLNASPHSHHHRVAVAIRVFLARCPRPHFIDHAAP